MVNLLRSSERRPFLENPNLLESFVHDKATDLPIVIDEVQLVPELIEEVYHLVETTDYRFLLDGILL